MIRKYMDFTSTTPHGRATNSSSRPYYGASRRFEFKGGEIAYVPQEVINKYSNFAGLVNEQPDNEPIKFNVTGRVGHTIVHFLFTETYQTLLSPPNERAKKPSGAFMEALEVYHQAVIKGLGELTDLAFEEIRRQGEDESFASIVKGVHGVRYMFEGDKTWLVEYLDERATMADEEVTLDYIEEVQSIETGCELVDILLEANMKLKLQLQQTEESDASSTE